jgi:pyruvate kinase
LNGYPIPLKNFFEQGDRLLTAHDFASDGDKVLLIGGLPMHQAGSTNFLKIHTIGQE